MCCVCVATNQPQTTITHTTTTTTNGNKPTKNKAGGVWVGLVGCFVRVCGFFALVFWFGGCCVFSFLSLTPTVSSVKFSHSHCVEEKEVRNLLFQVGVCVENNNNNNNKQARTSKKVSGCVAGFGVVFHTHSSKTTTATFPRTLFVSFLGFHSDLWLISLPLTFLLL